MKIVVSLILGITFYSGLISTFAAESLENDDDDDEVVLVEPPPKPMNSIKGSIKPKSDSSDLKKNLEDAAAKCVYGDNDTCDLIPFS